MRFWREVLDDRWLGCVLCALLALSFTVQIAGASRAAAALIASDPLQMICASTGGTAHRPADADGSKPCPCTELCAAGLQLPVPPAPADLSGVPIRFAERIEIAVDHSAPLSSYRTGRRYEARGPPAEPDLT